MRELHKLSFFSAGAGRTTFYPWSSTFLREPHSATGSGLDVQSKISNLDMRNMDKSLF